MDTDRTVVEDFIAKHPFSAAKVLEGLKAEEVAGFLSRLPKDKSIQLLRLMEIRRAADCFSRLPPKLATELMEGCDILFAESLCRQFDVSFRDNILSSLSPNVSSAIRQKLEQKANTVGEFMVPVAGVTKEMTVKDALETIAGNRESFESYLNIVDVQGLFQGATRLEELLLVAANTTIGELTITDMPSFFPDTPVQNIKDHPAWYEYRLIPVVDRSSGRLLGGLPYSTMKETIPQKGGQLTKDILETGTALSELYLVGLAGFLQSVGNKTVS